MTAPGPAGSLAHRFRGTDGEHDDVSTARQARTRRQPIRLASLLALAALTAAGLAPAAPVAGAPVLPPERAAAPRPVATAAATPVAATTVAAQTPEGDPAAGPYDPGFIDDPIATNPPSPALDDIPITSSELDRVEGLLTGAEDRRDDAIAHRDDLRQHIVDLGEQRTEAVAALEQRRQEEAAAGEAREAATAEHRRRADRAEAALDRLEQARDDLRELMIAAYVNRASNSGDRLALLSEEADVGDSLLRLGYGGTSVEARSGDVEARLDDRRTAVAAEDRARRDREAAEQAERDAVTAREAAEQHIVDLDAETERTRAEEADAVEAVADREADVVAAGTRIAPARLRADVDVDDIDFPLVALDAWVKAAAEAPCRVEWWALAGISKVEGRHGTHGGGRLGARGYPSVKIIGPQLDGSGAFAAIPDTDGGIYDGDPVWDRAVGPMQFIPSTWRAWGRDGDHDGAADPFTIYDAAAAATAYLCAGRTDLTQEDQLRAAYFSYNHSGHYVDTVLAAARRYQAALEVPVHVVVDDPDRPPLIPEGT